MDIEGLTGSPIGKLVPIRDKDARFGEFAYFAYMAEPLPDDVTLTSESWTAVAGATAAIAKLDQACLQLPDPRLLIRPTLWREALDTSALEGTVGGLRDLLEAQLPSAQFVSPETAEIRAYERVALKAFDAVEHRDITVSFLAELQAELFTGTKTQPRDLGQVRKGQVWIGDQDQSIENARFVPAPGGDRLLAGIQAWELWIAAEHDHLPAVLRAAMAHYQFETLHPFCDGNGRIGRLVVVLQLLKARALKYPALTVSRWFLKQRQQYQDHLLAVSATGDWNPWVRFFCQAIEEQCDRLIPSADGLVMWLKASRDKVNERRWHGTIHALLDSLIEWPVTTIADTAERHGVSVMNATRMIDHLVEIDVLKELTGRTHNRLFGALDVMEMVEGIGV